MHKLRNKGQVRDTIVKYKRKKQWHRRNRLRYLKNEEHATLKEHPSAQYKVNVEEGIRQKSLDS